jgi:hypothetical protein
MANPVSGIYWPFRKIMVQLATGRMSRITAQVYGAFAFHPSMDPGSGDLWSLTHLHTGLRVVLVKTSEDARRIGEYLWERYGLVFRHRTVKEVTSRMPPSVVRWLASCGKSREWLDPIIDSSKREAFSQPSKDGKRKKREPELREEVRE